MTLSGQIQHKNDHRIMGLVAGYSRRTIVVNSGGSIQAAIDAITDSSVTNPFNVLVMSGNYLPFSLDNKVGITVTGSGDSTVINCTTGITNQVQVHSTDCTIEKMRLVYTDSGNTGTIQACIRRNGGVYRIHLKDLKLEVDCSASADFQRWGIYLEYSNSHNRYDNIEIVTQCCGIYVPGAYNDYYNCNIWLTGNDAPFARYGVMAERSGRAYFHGGRVTTGYGETNPNITQNIYCFYIPAGQTDTGARVHLWGVEAFAASSNTNAGNLASVRAENGWVRIFGGMFQAENSGDTPSYTEKAIQSYYGTVNEQSTGSKGKIEIYGARYTGVSGRVFGESSVAVSHLDSSDDGLSLKKFEGRFFICDTATAFGVIIAGGNVGAYSENNSTQTFVNTGANNLTITAGASGTIDGSSTLVIAGGASANIIKTAEATWYTY